MSSYDCPRAPRPPPSPATEWDVLQIAPPSVTMDKMLPSRWTMLRISYSRLFQSCAESNETSSTWPYGAERPHLCVARDHALRQVLVSAHPFPDELTDSR